MTEDGNDLAPNGTAPNGTATDGTAPDGLEPNDLDPNDWSPRKLTHEQAKTEQRLYWSRKSCAERLAAMTALTKRMYRMRGIDLDELTTDLTPRFVRRRQR